MKIVRTTNGVKRIDDSDSSVTLFKIRQILDEQRSALITRLVSDLGTYIDYKFNVKIGEKQLESVKERLHSLKNSGLDLEKYHDLLEHVLKHERSYIHHEPFYKEIDASILWELNASQLKLVR